MRLTSTVSMVIALSTCAASLPVEAHRSSAPVGPTVEAVLDRAAGYLDTYERRFSAVVADETSTVVVVDVLPTMPGVSQHMDDRTEQRRDYRAEAATISVGQGGWVEFRDVYEVDHKAVRPNSQRLDQLFGRPMPALLAQARQVAAESATFEIGLARDFNIPTVGLTYLSRANQGRSTFSVIGQETLDGQRTVVVAFHETATPSLIRSAGQSVDTTGKFWILPDSGAVVQTNVLCRLDKGPTDTLAWGVRVTYGLDPALNLLLPKERAEALSNRAEQDHGHATYSHFRVRPVDPGR